jgi:hypothetical protein
MKKWLALFPLNLTGGPCFRLLPVVLLIFLVLKPGPAALYAEDGWEKVNAAEEIAGDWEGSLDIAIPRNPGLGLPKSVININITLRYVLYEQLVHLAMRLDLDRFLTDWANLDTSTEQGLTKDFFWALLEAQFKTQAQITVGGRYFIIANLSEPPASMFSGNEQDTILIDLLHTRIRIQFHETVSFGLGDKGIEEITLYRKTGELL